MRKTCLLFSLLLLLATFSGCSGKNLLDKPTDSPSTTMSPTPTGGEPSESFESKPFGRYAAAQGGMLYYVSDNAVYSYQNGSARLLCQVLSNMAPEDIYKPSGDILFVSSRLQPPDKDGRDHVVYQVKPSENPAVPVEAFRSDGPIIGKNHTLYYMKDGVLYGFDTKEDKTEKIAQPGKKVQLVNGGASAQSLYYNVYTQQNAGGTLYGPSKLYRLSLDNQKSVFIGDMNKPHSNEFFTITDSMIYQRELSEDGKSYNLRIIDSPTGPMEQIFTVSKQIFDDQLGMETLYTSGRDLFMLAMYRDGLPDDSSECYLHNYKLSSPSPAEQWRQKVPRAVMPLLYSDAANQIILLSEGNGNASFRVTTLNRKTGEQVQSFTNSTGDSLKNKLLVDAGGVVLVYKITGEDYPKATLLYGADLRNITTKLIP